MNKKKNYLIISIILDLIGMASLLFPVFGELIDIVWAPISGLILFFMYGKLLGFSGGLIEFTEEIFPFTDFIPTFTLVWIYNFKIKKQKELK